MISPRSWTFWTVLSLTLICFCTVPVLLLAMAFDCPNPEIEAQIEIGQLSQMVDSYYLATSPRRMPSSLDDLTEGPSPLTKEVPLDPWRNPYVYAQFGDGSYEIWSKGSDGILHTEDDIHAEGAPCWYQSKTENRVPSTEYRVPSTPNYKIKRPTEHARGGDQ